MNLNCLDTMERYFPKIPKRCPEGQEQPAAKKTKTD